MSREHIFDINVKRLDHNDVSNILTREYADEESLLGVPTGFARIDEKLNGLQNGKVYVVCGRPTMGVTTFALSLIKNCSIDYGLGSLFFSMDIDLRMIELKLIANVTETPFSKIVSARVDKEFRNRYLDVMDNIMNAPIYVVDEPIQTLESIKQRMINVIHGSEVKIVVIDHLQLISNPLKDSMMRLEGMRETMTQLKELVTADNLAEIVTGESSIDEVIEEFTVGYIFERYNDWTADWASTVYKWQMQHRERQKNLNEQVQGWREGLKEKVLRNEITIEEACQKIAEIEKGRQAYKKMYAAFWEDVTVSITEKDGKEVVTYTVVDEDGRSAEARNAPAKGESNKVIDVVRNYTERTKFGILDHINITYYSPSMGEENWSYDEKNGKMVLDSHTVYYGESKRDYPYYRVWIDYSNNVNPNVWGAVQVQLWVSPGGTILNTYTIDCRGKQSDYMNGKLPSKTSGEQFYFIERY